MPLTSMFLVQPLNAECGGLETAHKDLCQLFQYSNRMFEQILQILECELFKRRFQDSRGGPWRSSRFELECSWTDSRCCSKCVSASNLRKLKEKGKIRYTFSRGLLVLALALGSPSPEAKVYISSLVVQ